MKAPDHAEQQRNRILDAAEQCFIEHGFHAASMANIAETAQMSAGLIYRYFESKNAIILAIIDRQLEERRANIATLHSDEDFLERVAELFDCWLRGDRKFINPTLFLEMSAESSRDPKISQALQAADRTSRSDFTEWLKRRSRSSGEAATEEDCCIRAFILGCFIEGMAVRAVREPNIDAELVAKGLKRVIPYLLSFSSGGDSDG